MDTEKEKIDELKNKYDETAIVEEIQSSQVVEEKIDYEIQPEEKKSFISAIKEKIKSVLPEKKDDTDENIFEENTDVQPEKGERKKLTDIFSKSTIAVMTVAVVMVLLVGFLLGWLVPVLWK